MFDDTEKELLRLLIKESVQDGMSAHVEKEHKPMEERLNSTRRTMAYGSGLLAALAFLWDNLPWVHRAGN